MTATAGVVVFAALLAASAGSCSGSGRAEPGESEPARSEVALQIRNECSCTVTIYVLRAGQRLRIGTVRALSSETFSLPSQTVSSGEVQLLADVIGSTEMGRTERVVVRSGQYIVWTLAADLSRSSVAVFE